MTGLVRKATIFVVLGLVAAASAMADVPSPANCTVPAFIKVVGRLGALPDARGTFDIIVRDGGNFTVFNSLVTLDFSGCFDMRLCDSQPDSVNCPTSIVSKRTNIEGKATFTIIGGGLNAGGATPGPGVGCITIKASGITLSPATAVVFDEDGALGAAYNGVTVADFVVLLNDWGNGVYLGRSDFDVSGPPLITVADFVPWLTCWGDGTSASGCTTAYCP